MRALTEAPDAFGATLADWTGSGDTEERWRARLDDVDANFVALLEGTPIGQVAGTRTEHDGHAVLISMWVAPEARSTGVGDALVKAVESWALGVGAKRLTLSVKVGNKPAAALYQRHGFTRTEAPAKDGEFHMSKLLG